LRLSAAHEILFVAGHAPIYCRKIQYYADPAFKARSAVPPPIETGRGADRLLQPRAMANTGVARP
jgi:type IV secretion system protein VirD4